MADKPSRYRLKLSRLDFVSLVDDPAQPNAKTLLLKRRGAEVEGETHAPFVKSNDELGVAFFWAFTSTNPDGSPHYDLHGDAIDKSNLVQIAMDFMTTGGGSVDEMHDGQATDARAVAFPMDPEIAKAFGVETKTSGLMVMIKVNDEQLAKLKSGEYTGVSIAGLGVREPVAARKSSDRRYITDEVLGHQHEVQGYSSGNAWMTPATVEGGTSSHCHTVTRGTDGALVVLADAGHTHTLTEWPRVIVAPTDAVVVSEEESAKRAAKSTGPVADRNVNINKESTMDPTKELEDLKARIAALEASLAEAKATAELTDDEKAHAAKLDTSEAKRFRGLAKSERLAEVAKLREADPVVAVIGKDVYRKSTTGAELAIKFVAQEAEIEKAKVREIAKSTIGKLAGDDATHDAIIKAVRASGESAELIGKMLETLKGANALVASKGTAPGFGGVEDPATPVTKAAAFGALEKGLLAYAKANNITKAVWTDGLAAFTQTDEGAALKRAYDATFTG